MAFNIDWKKPGWKKLAIFAHCIVVPALIYWIIYRPIKWIILGLIKICRRNIIHPVPIIPDFPLNVEEADETILQGIEIILDREIQNQNQEILRREKEIREFKQRSQIRNPRLLDNVREDHYVIPQKKLETKETKQPTPNLRENDRRAEEQKKPLEKPSEIKPTDSQTETEILRAKVKKLEEKVKHGEKWKELQTSLLESDINRTEFTESKPPVIAFDAYIYSQPEYNTLEYKSYHTRQPITKNPPFPFKYTKLLNFKDARDDIDELKELCIDPITGEIMKTPCIVVLKLQNTRETIYRVMVCDDSIRKKLQTGKHEIAKEFKVKVESSRELTPLADVIKFKKAELEDGYEVGTHKKGWAWITGTEILKDFEPTPPTKIKETKDVAERKERLNEPVISIPYDFYTPFFLASKAIPPLQKLQNQLIHACENGNLAEVKLLLGKGANPTLMVLSAAVFGMNPHIVNLILEKLRELGENLDDLWVYIKANNKSYYKQVFCVSEGLAINNYGDWFELVANIGEGNEYLLSSHLEILNAQPQSPEQHQVWKALIEYLDNYRIEVPPLALARYERTAIDSTLIKFETFREEIEQAVKAATPTDTHNTLAKRRCCIDSIKD